ncbi:unnamed protein product [Adineta steineri]|uniref:NAD(P)(+)--arginine ADP-ribosyltransferase n=1 Tax=Adineta steineri TaxID=433720 RepID=A0A815JCC4_9BILA|nr:unnamed protein product [Adineta steineri]CAF3985556.1 unnamed protein product [Adineta steineri]
MFESNKPGDQMKSFVQKAIEQQKIAIERSLIFIVVHDNEEQIERFKNIAMKNEDSAQRIFPFSNFDTFYDFIIEKVSSRPAIKIIILVGGQLVDDVVSSIHFCEQVQSILILNKSSISNEERESLKTYSKVKYMEDYHCHEFEHDLGQQFNIKEAEQTRFNDFPAFDLLPNDQFNEDNFPDLESIQRSFKQVDKKFLFRFLMIMSLRTASSFSSDKDNLIKLFETEYQTSSENIIRFKETYSSDKAIFFYTRDPFIYGQLNNALRTSNIDHLLSFQFIFQDICNELYKIMIPITDNQIFHVYRGQILKSVEMAELFIGYCKKSFIMTTSFLSTSKNRHTALGFLSATDHSPFDLNYSAVLFKITIRNRDRSFYFPFANISALSNHPEESEVLFTPGQIFNIDNFDVIWENNSNIFLFEISLNEKFDNIQTGLKSLFSTKNPWYLIGTILIENKQFDQAKELYMRLLSEYDDKNEQYECYSGLYGIAMNQNDQIEMQNIHRKMTEIRFNFIPPDLNSILKSMTEEESTNFYATFEHIKKMCSLISMTRPINEVLSFIQSDEFRAGSKQLQDSLYPCAKVLIKCGEYDQVIVILEYALKLINISPIMSKDSLEIIRCYMQLGHCYRELKLYDESLKHYNSIILEQRIQLPIDEQVELLIGFGKTLENINSFSDALDRYIEVAEIYKNYSMIGDTEQRHQLEEMIQQVLLHLIPADDSCKIS